MAMPNVPDEGIILKALIATGGNHLLVAEMLSLAAPDVLSVMVDHMDDIIEGAEKIARLNILNEVASRVSEADVRDLLRYYLAIIGPDNSFDNSAVNSPRRLMVVWENNLPTGGNGMHAPYEGLTMGGDS